MRPSFNNSAEKILNSAMYLFVQREAILRKIKDFLWNLFVNSTLFKIISWFCSKNGWKKINRDFIKGGRGGGSPFYEVISQKIFNFTKDGFLKVGWIVWAKYSRCCSSILMESHKYFGFLGPKRRVCVAYVNIIWRGRRGTWGAGSPNVSKILAPRMFPSKNLKSFTKESKISRASKQGLFVLIASGWV